MKGYRRVRHLHVYVRTYHSQYVDIQNINLSATFCRNSNRASSSVKFCLTLSARGPILDVRILTSKVDPAERANYDIYEDLQLKITLCSLGLYTNISALQPFQA